MAAPSTLTCQDWPSGEEVMGVVKFAKSLNLAGASHPQPERLSKRTYRSDRYCAVRFHDLELHTAG
jgi:hypothetical protein